MKIVEMPSAAFARFRDWMAGRESEPIDPNDMVCVDLEKGTRTPVSKTEGGKLFKMLMKPLCPDCGSKEGFYAGPSGGMSTNIGCVNRECRSAFNVTPMFGTGTADRIGKWSIDRYP